MLADDENEVSRSSFELAMRYQMSEVRLPLSVSLLNERFASALRDVAIIDPEGGGGGGENKEERDDDDERV